jgi:DNA-binding NtrC family response regulator
LLRVVEERAYEALGSDATEKLRARLVFATNRDLAGEVDAGRFRRDLYYRLNVVALTVPPLRSRLAEIPVLVAAFLRDLRARQATEVKEFSPDALAALERHSWPGNLRELRNVVERVAVMCDCEVVTATDLPAEIRTDSFPNCEDAGGLDEPAIMPPAASQLAGARQLAERQTIVRTLQQCMQNRSQAAQALGISRAAFYKKLNRLGIA